MKFWAKAGAIAAALLILVAGAAVLGGIFRLDRPGPLQADTTVIVERGASLTAIAENLQSGGVIDDAFLFRLSARLYRVSRSLKAGEYAFPARVSMGGVIDILVSGETVIRQFTVPEGLTSAEVMTLIAGVEGLVGELDGVPTEGSLLPETYNYAWADARPDIVGRMEKAMADTLAELWPTRAEGLPIDTPAEAVILASIVEKETGVAEERPLVAGVFINRLKRGMRLQSDPTVVYALTGGTGPLDRALRSRDLRVDNPYNTYGNAGLPPGPIANPGRAALEAVLNPAETDYLYFVADGTGGHAFAKTLAEHNRNVAKWRRIRRTINR
ncbi:MAG: endolytic transglycosylase MltG [Kiloniellales bacterium]|nr:endolytic transglycosylase MltG [Kiloniellales bacterium]MDJ0982723.1 endolytic transglycosylase MltG [Kiloniellales bacterium]